MQKHTQLEATKR